MKTELITAWRYLDKGHCAFKSSATSPEKIRCNHLFTVTGQHKLSDCPLIQPKFFSFQQQEGTVYIIEKNPEAVPASMWGFTELPEKREEAKKVVTKKIKGLDEDLVSSIWKKFDQQYSMAELIRSSEELKEDGSDLED
jgi:hypothetical protein